MLISDLCRKVRGCAKPSLLFVDHQSREDELTLNTNVYVVLRLLGLSCVFVRFGEGVY
jgi:hypothetical protein